MTVANETEVHSSAEVLSRLRTAMNGVLFGQDHLIDDVLIGLVAGGHVLLEGLPGLGKTELVKALAKAIQLEPKRVQFTPDLLPGDITGNPVLQELDGMKSFVFRPGPLFGNLVLADEVNRASPKTQSALLEAMQERQVTVMGEVHRLPQPFFVLATQNPIELEGTYPLPEAQLDRFLFKLEVTRSSIDVLERIVLERDLGAEPAVAHVLTGDELLGIMKVSRRIYLPNVVARYVARIVDATHPGCSTSAAGVKFGAGPRAAIALAAASRARALLEGRLNASFEDVTAVAKPVLRHRLILDYSARLEGRTADGVIEALLEEVSPDEVAVPSTLAGGR
jgi:MoxR-like ATPase